MSIKWYRDLPYWLRKAVVTGIQLAVVMVGVLLSASTAKPGELHHYQPAFDVAADTLKTCPDESADFATSILKVALPSADPSSISTNNTTDGGK